MAIIKDISKLLFRKKKPSVKLNKTYGVLGGTMSSYLDYPGGALLTINLDDLTLWDYSQMKDDYYIAACLNIISFYIHQNDWEIKSNSKKAEEVLTRQLREIWLPLIRSISSAFWSGYSANAKVFDLDNEGYVAIKKLRDLRPETARVYVGDTLEEKKENKFKGIKQGVDLIPPDYCFWYTFQMRHGDWEGTKLLRPAYAPYFFSQIIHLFTNRHLEKFGSPTMIGLAPSDREVMDSDKKSKPAIDVMETILTKIRNYSAVTIPSDRDEDGNPDFDIKLLESLLKGSTEFMGYLNRLDKEKALAIFTPQLLFETAEVGSYNLGSEHKKTFLHMLNGIMQDIKPYIENFILKQLAEINFGEGVKVEFVPRQLGMIDEKSAGNILHALIQTGTAKPDLEQLSATIGIKMEEAERLGLPLKPQDNSGNSDKTPVQEKTAGNPGKFAGKKNLN